MSFSFDSYQAKLIYQIDIFSPAISQVYIAKTLNSNKADGIKHSFTALSDKFGQNKPNEDVFELFGEFERGEHDVLFDVSISRGLASVLQ